METSGKTNGAGQSLQDNSSELMRCLETLRGERDALSKDLALDLEERNKIQLDVQVLVRRLNTVTENAGRRARARDDYDTCLAETEAAHAKITESTRTLLSVAMREAAVLSKSAGMEASTRAAVNNYDGS